MYAIIEIILIKYPRIPTLISTTRIMSLVFVQNIGLNIYVVTEPIASNNRKLLNAASSLPTKRMP